jgi:hypothetical protein
MLEHLHSHPQRPPKRRLGAPAPKIPPSRALKQIFHSARGVFFFWRTRSKPSARGGGEASGGAGYAQKHRGPSLSARRYHSSSKSTIASRTPTRSPLRRLATPFPDGAPSFHQIAAVARHIAPARQLFEVVHRIASLSRGASNLDLAQEVFGVLPRPWTSSWTPTTRPCSPL